MARPLLLLRVSRTLFIAAQTIKSPRRVCHEDGLDHAGCTFLVIFQSSFTPKGPRGSRAMRGLAPIAPTGSTPRQSVAGASGSRPRCTPLWSPLSMHPSPFLGVDEEPIAISHRRIYHSAIQGEE